MLRDNHWYKTLTRPNVDLVNTPIGHITADAVVTRDGVMQCLRELLETDAQSMECRQEPHDAFNTLLDATHANMVWAHRGVGNWYRNKDGRVVTNSPFRLVDYRRMTEKLDRADHVLS